MSIDTYKVPTILDPNLHFSTVDYVVCGVLLVITAYIGIHFGFISKHKQNNTSEYLMGSRSMKIIPVAISLVASSVSSVSLLALPAEVYLYGTQYFVNVFNITLAGLAMGFIFLPVFYELQDLTIYSYLEKRFDRKMRQLATVMYTLNSLFYMPLMIYAPALAFSQTSGIPTHVITTITCLLCIFYTMFGGIRAVIWTDTLQFGSMMGALIFLAIFGTHMIGGVHKLYDVLDKSGRIVFFNMDPDPTLRQSFWLMVIGIFVAGHGVCPEIVQRFQSLPTYRDVIKCLILFTVGHIVVRLMAAYCGAVIFASYVSCDPFILGIVKKVDQLFPYYVMDVARNLPGIPGVFVAGIFSAGLSSISTILNCLAGYLYTDLLKRYFPDTTEKTDSTIMKLLVLTIGIVSLGLVFIVEHLGSLFNVAVSFLGITSGTLFGLFVLGMMIPSANKHGAFWGWAVSFLTISFIAFGAQFFTSQGKLKYESKPLYSDGCDTLGLVGWQNSPGFIGTPNSTVHILNENFDNSAVPLIFRIGFLYYAPLGSIIVVLVGYFTSILTGGCADIDEQLLCPPVRKRIEQSRKVKHQIELSVLNSLVHRTKINGHN